MQKELFGIKQINFNMVPNWLAICVHMHMSSLSCYQFQLNFHWLEQKKNSIIMIYKAQINILIEIEHVMSGIGLEFNH